MRTFLFVFLLFEPLLASPGVGWEAIRLRDMIATNLEFLDGGKFPKKPGSGYPWLTVTVGKSKTVLLCPEDGVGEAILIYADGSVERTVATTEKRKLSYGVLIKPHEGKQWVTFDKGDGWTKLPLNHDGKRSHLIATQFVFRMVEAALEQGRPK